MGQRSRGREDGVIQKGSWVREKWGKNKQTLRGVGVRFECGVLARISKPQSICDAGRNGPFRRPRNFHFLSLEWLREPKLLLIRLHCWCLLHSKPSSRSRASDNIASSELGVSSSPSSTIRLTSSSGTPLSTSIHSSSSLLPGCSSGLASSPR